MFKNTILAKVTACHAELMLYQRGERPRFRVLDLLLYGRRALQSNLPGVGGLLDDLGVRAKDAVSADRGSKGANAVIDTRFLGDLGTGDVVAADAGTAAAAEDPWTDVVGDPDLRARWKRWACRRADEEKGERGAVDGRGIKMLAKKNKKHFSTSFFLNIWNLRHPWCKDHSSRPSCRMA